MRYSDGRANNILGNSTLFLFFICAFAFVTLWPELTKEKHLFSRYFEHFQRPLEFNTSKCQNLREDIRKIHFLSMVWEAELFDRWRRLEIVCVWRQNHSEAQTFRLMLQRCCNAPSLLFVTQSNTPISSTVHYEQESVKNVPIESSIYYMLPKSMPYQRQQLARCAVVGNGGILHNSRCGSEIDAMEFVFRCNLPPVSAEFAKDVGSKTDIVTINPSIIIDRYDSLMQRHGPFLARIRSYGNASLLLPAFFGGRSMELALRARYVLDEAGSSRPLYFFHPIYLAHVGAFWRRHGVQERRSSSGLLVASAALELCREVHLYGFWPFSQDVDGAHLSHHYYDDQRPRPGIHVMPIENFHFLQLHSKGILRVHTQRCSN